MSYRSDVTFAIRQCDYEALLEAADYLDARHKSEDGLTARQLICEIPYKKEVTHSDEPWFVFDIVNYPWNSTACKCVEKAVRAFDHFQFVRVGDSLTDIVDYCGKDNTELLYVQRKIIIV